MTTEKKVGIFFVVAVLIALFLLESVEDRPFFRQEYPLRTYFRSVKGLERGDAVRLAGLKVGEVKDIKIVGDRVEVLISLNKGVPVKADSRAAIKMPSLLGGRYLGLSLGSLSSPLLEPDSVVDSIDTPDLDELLTKVNTIVSDMGRIAKKIESGEGTLGKLITDDALYQEARKAVREIAKAAEGVQDQTPLATFTNVLFGISR